VTIEDQHGVIHGLAITPVEKAELLLAVGGIISGIDVEQHLATLGNVIAVQSDELLVQQVTGVHPDRGNGSMAA
jgi:hypothetical protein